MKTLIRKTYKNTKRLLNGNRDILIAVSTGIDSMVLLEYFLQIKDGLDLNIGVLHVNHGLREQSDIEEEYLKKYCLEKGLPLFVGHYSEDDFSENKARQFRYDFAKQIMEEHGYSVLATAHHKSDQAETVLMRIIRGSRLLDLSGIKETQEFKNGILIRPLLSVHKSELPDVFHFEDETNHGNDYFRNRVRNQYIPTLTNENVQFSNQLVNIAQEVSSMSNALKELTSSVDYNNMSTFLSFSRDTQTFFLQDYLSRFDKLQVNKNTLKELLNILNNPNLSNVERYIKSDYLLVKNKESWHIKKAITN